MRASPGGQLAPEAIVGRDRLIAQLWRTLEVQSVVLGAERRMGKTSIVKKMQSAPPPGIISIYRDLERVREPIEFAESVCQDLEVYLSKRNLFARRTRQLLKDLQGMEISGIVKFPASVAHHWKALLISTIEDLMEQRDEQLVFFWDELPLMLYNVKQRGGEEPAMEMLDTLRSLRQSHAALRMVFTGSIGLHHVITGLRRVGYVNDATNDMRAVDVPPLSQTDARDLAYQLLTGEGLTPNDPRAVEATIAEQVDNIPFFIHHVVAELVTQHEDQGGSPDPAAVQAIVAHHLVAPQDPWHLRYYRERLDQYYDDATRPLALVMLDALAGAATPLPFDQIANLVQARLAAPDPERMRAALTLLQQDYYVVQEDASAAYRFRLQLIRRYWQRQRGT